MVFAGIVLVLGLAVYGALRSRGDLLPSALRALAQRITLLFAIGIPAVVFTFSILRVIPAGHVA